MTEKVVRCDLRPHSQPFTALQEVFRLLADKSEPDLSLLLVIDTPQTMVAHVLAYEELWRSRRVEKLLGIAVGPLMLPDGFEIPGSIGPDRDSGIIWVSDAEGVDWRLAGSAIASVHPNDRSDAGLEKLIDVLSTSQVFRKTLGLIADIPAGVANPGLNVFEVSASQVMFLAALNRSLKKMLDPDTTDLHARLAATDESAWVLDTVHSAIVPTGRLAVARDRCVAEAEELSDALEALVSPTALYGGAHLGARVRDLAVRAGMELTSYRAAVLDLTGTSAVERADRLFDWGVRPTAGSGAVSDDIMAAISTSIRAGEPLPVVSMRLRDYERKMRSHGEVPYSDQIEQICPRTLGQRFTASAPVPGPEPWLIAAGAAATAVASFGRGFGVITGLVVALTWLGLLGLTIARAPGGRPAGHTGSLAAGTIAAILGLSGGILLGRHIGASTTAGILGFAIGLGLSVAATSWSWKGRIRRWRDALQTEDLTRAAEGLTNIVTAAANREWSANETRQDAIITTKATLDGATSALRAYQQKIDHDLALEPPRHVSRHEFDEFVGRGLSLLVAEALGPIFHASRPRSPREYEGWASRRVSDLLAEWDKHVEINGPLDLPEFTDGQDLKVSVLGENDIAEITAIITAEPRDTMWQLCQAADIRLLDYGITKVPTVRFAPRTLLLNTNEKFPAEMEWIDSTRYAGLLRLVPLRQGVVHRTWMTSDEPGGETADEELDGESPMDGEEVR